MHPLLSKKDFVRKNGSGKCETDAFVWDIPQAVKVEDVKAFVPDFSQQVTDS